MTTDIASDQWNASSTFKRTNMPVWALELILYLGKHALEYAQKNWTGERKDVILELAPGTPCTVDCRKT